MTTEKNVNTHTHTHTGEIESVCESKIYLIETLKKVSNVRPLCVHTCSDDLLFQPRADIESSSTLRGNSSVVISIRKRKKEKEMYIHREYMHYV